MEIVRQDRRVRTGRRLSKVPAVVPATDAAARGKPAEKRVGSPEAAPPRLPVAITGDGRDPGPRPRFAASAALLAQLIAGRLDLPQTRSLRRASPREADTAYLVAERLSARRAPPRRRLRA